MECLFLFAAFLTISITYGYPPDSIPSEKIKLTSEPRYYPDKKSDYEKRRSSSDRDEEVTNHADSNEDSPSNHNLYKPQRDYVSFGPSEEDSKYIPHNKIYSKYFIPKKIFAPEEEEKKDQTDHEKKSEEIPRYGFLRENSHHPEQKHSVNEHVEDSPEQNEHEKEKYPEPFKYGAKYNTHTKKENNEYEDYEKPHNTFPEQRDESRKYIQPKHKEEPRIYYERHPYPDDRKESRFHNENAPYPEKKEPRYPYKSSNYPEYKEEPKYPKESPNYLEPKEEPRYPYENPNYPEHKEVSKIHHESRHYIEHREHPRTPLESHNHPKEREDYNRVYYERRPHHSHFKPEHENYARSRNYPEYKEEQVSYRGNYPDRYEDANDKDSETYPKRNMEKLIEELKEEGKSRHESSGFEDSSKYKEHHNEKPPYEPYVGEFVKEGKFDSHKYHHLPSNEPHQKEKHQGHSPLKHDFHVNKYHREDLFPSFMNFKPNFNFGGLRHSSVYKPKIDIYQELRKDLDIKMRLLKEHEEKLAELQKGHIEKYRALFEPNHVKTFLDLELPKHANPSIDPKYDSYIEPERKNHGPVEPPHKSKSGYDDYPRESNYTYHKLKSRPHYDASRHDEENAPSKHDNKNYEPKHIPDHHHHHHRKDYTT